MPPGPAPLQTNSRALAAQIGVGLMTALGAGVTCFAGARWAEGLPPGAMDDLTTWLAAEFVLLLLAAPVFFLAALLFLNWWGALADQAEARGIGVSGVPGGALGCWFIPLVNLYGPYAFARGVAQRLNAKAPVGLWWCTWVTALVCAGVAASEGPRALRGAGSPALVVAALLLTVSGASCLWVIAALQRALSRA